MFKLFFILTNIVIVSLCLFDNEINLDCFGETFNNVTLTAYYPDYSDKNHDYLDIKGNKLCTLQDYMDDRNDYVTLSMDQSLNRTYGSVICIPELNKHFGHRIRFELRDTSSDLKGSGYLRADICVRTEIDSYDYWVNRKVTLIFVKSNN